jgi:ABC-type lipoprotein export system ATPase subunit
MAVFRRLADDRGVTAIVSTHDPLLIGVADRTFELRDGAVA